MTLHEVDLTAAECDDTLSTRRRKHGLATLLPAIAQGLRDTGAHSVAVETVAGSGHYVIDEKPAEVAALIERYASITRTVSKTMERN